MNKNSKRKSLADAIIQMDTSISAPSFMPEIKVASDLSPFEKKKKGVVDDIFAKYESNQDTDLNVMVAKAIEENGFNENEGLRIIQAVNMRIYQYLYDKTSGLDERHVKFDIADPAKILKKNAPDSATVVDENNEKVAMEKVASAPMTLAERIMGLDSSTIEFYSPVVAPHAKEELLMERVARDLSATQSSFEKVASDVSDSKDLLGRAFVVYANSPNIDHQKVFEKMAFQANMRMTKQAEIIECFNRAKALDKKASDASLELVDIDAVEDFSLGRHSISKIAEQDVLSLPEVSDKKKDIKNFQKLVEVALKIQEDEALQESLLSKLEAKKELVSSLN